MTARPCPENAVDLPACRNDAVLARDILSPVERAFLEQLCPGDWSIEPTGSAHDGRAGLAFDNWRLILPDRDAALRFKLLMAIEPSYRASRSRTPRPDLPHRPARPARLAEKAA